MKKIMSLLLALALVLSMPGMALAATDGQLVDGGNTIELPWDTREASVYTYTATQTGTLYIAATDFAYSSGDFNYEDNTENWDEWTMYTELTVDGQTLEGGYYGSVEVVEGQTYTFSWAHGADVANERWYKLGWRAELDLRYTDELVPKAGTADMPVELRTEQCPTDSIQIAAGETAYYLLYDFGGACFTVAGEGAYVLVETFDMVLGETIVTRYDAENGVVTVPVENYYVTLQIGNDGDEAAVFTLDYFYPQGSRENPAQVVNGDNVAVTEAENYDGYYFTFTAECNGTLTLTFPETGWMYSAYSSSGNLDVFCVAGEEGAQNPLVVEVTKGDVITINLNSFDSTMFNVPGGDVVMKAAISYDHNYEDGFCKDCGEEEKLFELGDANGDGRVNARDARLVLRYAAGLAEESELVLAAADYNGDDKVNARDARTILRVAAGLD